MRVGYLESLPSIPASEASKRAVRMAKQALEQKGFTLVKFELSLEEIAQLRDVMIGLVGNYSGLRIMQTMD